MAVTRSLVVKAIHFSACSTIGCSQCLYKGTEYEILERRLGKRWRWRFLTSAARFSVFNS